MAKPVRVVSSVRGGSGSCGDHRPALLEPFQTERGRPSACSPGQAACCSRHGGCGAGAVNLPSSTTSRAMSQSGSRRPKCPRDSPAPHTTTELTTVFRARRLGKPVDPLASSLALDCALGSSHGLRSRALCAQTRQTRAQGGIQINAEERWAFCHNKQSLIGSLMFQLCENASWSLRGRLKWEK